MTTQSDIRRFYDAFSRTTLIRDFSYFNLRQQAIRDFCDRHVVRGSRVLEIGCGVGIITKFLQKKADRVVALDISPENIAIAERFASAGNTEFLTLDVLDNPEALDDRGEFDVVLLADVIEHIPPERYADLFNAIERRLSPAGLVLLTYPSPEHQGYLTAHEPDVLQVVDEKVELDNLIRAATSLKPLLFQYVNIWRRNDYVHVILSPNREFDPKFLQRSAWFWFTYRVRKYRWRFGNFFFLRKLRKAARESESK